MRIKQTVSRGISIFYLFPSQNKKTRANQQTKRELDENYNLIFESK